MSLLCLCCFSLYVLGTHNSDSFDVVLSGVDASPHVHSADCLAELARVLKPSGKVLLREPTVKEGVQESMGWVTCWRAGPGT